MAATEGSWAAAMEAWLVEERLENDMLGWKDNYEDYEPLDISQQAVFGAADMRAEMDALLEAIGKTPAATGPGLREEKVGCVLLQAKKAAQSLRDHLDRLKEFKLSLPEVAGDWPSNAEALLKTGEELLAAFFGTDLGDGVLYLYAAIKLAVMNGGVLTSNSALAGFGADTLHEALLANQCPDYPKTQSSAFLLIESALLTIKLAQEHHLICLVEHLDVADTGAAMRSRSGGSDVLPSRPSGEPVHSVFVVQTRRKLEHAILLANIAVNHIETAVLFLSTFLGPEELAAISEYAEFDLISRDGRHE